MSIVQNKLYDDISAAFIEAIKKVNADATLSLSDMYVCVKYDDLSLSIYDDIENMLLQTTIDEWEDLKDDSDDFIPHVASALKKVLGSDLMRQQFETLDSVGPFSVILIGEDMEVIEELITYDSDTIFLDNDFLDKMDKDLDDFFEKLMSDIK